MKETARPPPTLHTPVFGQAERAGPQGSKALGIKAEWPRLAEAWGAAREPDGGTLPRIGYMMAQMGYDVATLF